MSVDHLEFIFALKHAFVRQCIVRLKVTQAFANKVKQVRVVGRQAQTFAGLEYNSQRFVSRVVLNHLRCMDATPGEGCVCDLILACHTIDVATTKTFQNAGFLPRMIN